jgi:hypothetical protein
VNREEVEGEKWGIILNREDDYEISFSSILSPLFLTPLPHSFSSLNPLTTLSPSSFIFFTQSPRHSSSLFFHSFSLILSLFNLLPSYIHSLLTQPHVLSHLLTHTPSLIFTLLSPFTSPHTLHTLSHPTHIHTRTPHTHKPECSSKRSI